MFLDQVASTDSPKSRPIKNPSDRRFPARDVAFASRRIDFRAELSIDLPRLFDRREIAPDSDPESGGEDRAEGSRFEVFRSLEFQAEDIGLELHHQVIRGSSPVDVHSFERSRQVLLHRREEVADLEGDSLENGTSEMRLR